MGSVCGVGMISLSRVLLLMSARLLRATSQRDTSQHMKTHHLIQMVHSHWSFRSCSLNAHKHPHTHTHTHTHTHPHTHTHTHTHTVCVCVCSWVIVYLCVRARVCTWDSFNRWYCSLNTNRKRRYSAKETYNFKESTNRSQQNMRLFKSLVLLSKHRLYVYVCMYGMCVCMHVYACVLVRVCAHE